MLGTTVTGSRAPSSDTGFMKAVAMGTMLVDHVGVIFFPAITELRVVGRIAFPLFAWCAVVGTRYTRSLWRYAARMLVLGLVAQPFYMLALGHSLDEMNVLCTLLLGIAGIAGMKKRRYLSQWWAPVLCVMAGAIVKMDYGWRGVLLMQLMYLARTDRAALAAMMTPFCLFWGTASVRVDSLMGLPLRIPAGWGFLTKLESLLSPFLKLQALALGSLPFMLWDRRTGWRVPKWLAYAWYPGHLALLYVAARLLR